MTIEWQQISLGKACVKIGSGATPRGGKEAYRGGNTALVRSQNIYNDRFTHEGLAYIDDAQAHELRSVVVEEGDVLLNITGDSVARCCQVDPKILPARVNQHVAIIRPRSDLLDARFLRYVFVSPSMQEHLRALASAGATRNALTKGMIESLVIYVPAVEQQRAIAHILGVLDDKIELNRKINETLEAMAQTLFKSWFVDFVPTKPFTEVVQVLGGGTPKTAIAEYWDGSIPFFTPKDAHGLYALTTEKNLTEVGLRKCNSRLYPVNTVFVTARGTVGKLAMSGVPMAMNQSCYALVGSEGYGQHFVYHLALETIRHLKRKASGAVFDAIVTRDFESEIVAVPPIDEVNRFEEKVKPIYAALLNNANESVSLAALRDTLLPKLISGQLRIKDAEKFLELYI